MPETSLHPIRLRNSLTRRVEPFVPLDWLEGSGVPEADRRVRMYVCGPTVYDRAHLGNARSAVVYDVLFRLLRHVYGEDRVVYVRNITDIDDKIIARAEEAGRSVESITEETTAWYHEDMDALGCLRPTHEPRATEYLPQMIAMTRALIEKGHAYEAQGHVLFSVSSYGAYGRLSGRSVEDMIAGARVEVAPYKRDPMDFVLWKPSGEGIPGWPSPWGRGRPGWHIECSAMARDLLGGAFDIHGGGLDLQFPHHENEIAQSRCAHPDEGFAQVWMHNEMLMVDGRKMSKSLGNFFTVRDLLDRGVPGEVMRLVLLGAHYGKPLDWSANRVERARNVIRKTFDFLLNSSIHPTPQNIAYLRDQEYAHPPEGAMQCLFDDINTASTLGKIQALSKRSDVDAAYELIGTLLLLGLVEEKTEFDLLVTTGVAWAGDYNKDIEQRIMHLLFSRQNARRCKDYDKADLIRDLLTEAGVIVEDRPDGPQWSLASTFDRAKLESIE